ncbi:Ger(x)C family spore germination protein [Bacillus paramycoides]|uniref:Ger(x)C family spore germination protein n=1 Tax=Bacillus paramycoides TaxID=2026194 RepID=UPI0015BABAEE|nr:Ger(x)C family spore germination protein [Bacillus paramycoides]NWK68958.1 Ger(x)C family spore germination protein [Bacillus paramycoides]
MKRQIMMLFIFTVLLTGCWSGKELNEIAINLAVGIDKVGNQYLVSCQVVNPGEVANLKGGSGRTPVVLFQEKASTISEAIRKITTIAPRKIYWAHIRMLIIDEKVAKEGIHKILDLFLRSHEIRSDFYIAISKNVKAENVLKVLTSLDKIPANKMFASLNVSQKFWAPTVTVTIDQLVSNLMSDGIHPVVTGITIKGDVTSGEKTENTKQIKPNTSIQYSESGVFKKDKLIGWLNKNQSKGYNYIMNRVENTIAPIPCSAEENVVFEVIKSKTKVKEIVKNKKHMIEIELHLKGNITEVQCKNLDLTNPKTIHQLERVGEKRVAQVIKEALKAAQKKYEVDIFGFGEVIHRENPQYWNKIKSSWDQKFVNLPVSIKAHVQLKHTGNYKNSFLKEFKK